MFTSDTNLYSTTTPTRAQKVTLRGGLSALFYCMKTKDQAMTLTSRTLTLAPLWSCGQLRVCGVSFLWLAASFKSYKPTVL